MPAAKILAIAVGFLAVAATRTSPAGVPRIDEDQRHSSESRLVLQELPELRKRPATVPGTLFTPNRCPCADALEILDGNTTAGVFGGFYNGFRHYMVCVVYDLSAR